MKLQLKRPIVFFDLETTGLNITHDRIVNISVIKVSPGKELTPEVKTHYINPEMPIPPESTAVHKITDDMVADKPTFRQIAKSLADYIKGCDIAGFNSNRFDVPMLDEEFRRVGVDFDFHKARFIDVQTIYHKKEPRNLKAAYRFYCDKDLDEDMAHTAQGDTQATYEVFLAQLERYEDLPADIEELAKFSSQNNNVDFAGRLIYNDQGFEVINFGKYKGRIASEVLSRDPGYYSWIESGDFPGDTKRAFLKIYMQTKKK